MTVSEAIKKLKQHFEYLKHAWKPYPDYETMDAIGYAVSALEKQIPKKPLAHQCTSCGSAVLPFDGSYCSNCGQKLDWSDEE